MKGTRIVSTRVLIKLSYFFKKNSIFLQIKTIKN